MEIGMNHQIPLKRVINNLLKWNCTHPYHKLFIRDPQTKTGWSRTADQDRTGHGPAEFRNLGFDQNRTNFSNLEPDQDQQNFENLGPIRTGRFVLSVDPYCLWRIQLILSVTLFKKLSGDIWHSDFKIIYILLTKSFWNLIDLIWTWKEQDYHLIKKRWLARFHDGSFVSNCGFPA